LPALERHHDVLAMTLARHAGGLSDRAHRRQLAWRLPLARARRARAGADGRGARAGRRWAQGDESYKDTLDYFTTMQDLLKSAAPHAEAILAAPQGRRRATQDIATNFEHIPVELLAHQMRGAAGCDAVFGLIDHATRGLEPRCRKDHLPRAGRVGDRGQAP